jgi:hypothetical protein
MKKMMLLVLLVVNVAVGHTQSDRIQQILSATLRKPVYVFENIPGIEKVLIPCAYGSSLFQFPEAIPDLDKVQVLSIDLCFTDHPSEQSLIPLNTARLNALFARYPGFKDDTTILWRVIRQTNGSTKPDALLLYHGFVIHYRPMQNDATIMADREKLKTLLTPETIINLAKRRGFVAADTMRLREQYEIEEYTNVQKLPVLQALQYLGIDPKDRALYRPYDSLFVYEKPLPDSTDATTVRLQAPEDSTVLQVLNRMPWQRMLVVADVTASMYPYTAQLMYWLKINEEQRRIHQFVFFNDGDEKDETAKTIGRTGGIYTTGSSVFEVVEKMVFTTMSKGSGGAIPENNIEAILTGISACPECGDIVMIADNWSPIRDLELLTRLQRPVHIILCGVQGSLQPDYLTLAWRTGGTIHFGTQDISDWSNCKEGAPLRWLDQEYTIVNGRIIRK